jgi:hypothetical protein
MTYIFYVLRRLHKNEKGLTLHQVTEKFRNEEAV